MRLDTVAVGDRDVDLKVNDIVKNAVTKTLGSASYSKDRAWTLVPNTGTLLRPSGICWEFLWDVGQLRWARGAIRSLMTA